MLWRSKEDANREAVTERTLSLRSRLRYLSVDAEESMLEVESGHLPQGMSQFFSNQKRPLTFATDLHQGALPAF